jgi:hypothetical protein
MSFYGSYTFIVAEYQCMDERCLGLHTRGLEAMLCLLQLNSTNLKLNQDLITSIGVF